MGELPAPADTGLPVRRIRGAGPTVPDGKETNWLQTIPGKGWFTVIRFYNPLPSFFDKTWRPSEIEPS